MSGQIVLQSPTLNRRQPLLSSSHGSKTMMMRRSGSSRFAEVAGGTTAECAAVCCCCPCGIVNLIVTAIYKYPAGLCRKALKETRKQQLIKKGLLPKRRRSKGKCGCCDDDFELQIHSVVDFQKSFADVFDSEESQRKVMELEKEMWERFYSTGFWRSPSQREEALNS